MTLPLWAEIGLAVIAIVYGCGAFWLIHEFRRPATEKDDQMARVDLELDAEEERRREAQRAIDETFGFDWNGGRHG
jgi:flagellar biosynthesis/type III secretory pathway M-ring protein FliF/YscJ